MFRSRPSLALLASLALGLGARADTTLAATSPFAPPDGAAGAVAAENQPLELRGILLDGDTYRFSIYDPARKTGQWVRLNEPGHDFMVKAYDAAHGLIGDTVTLDYQGRRLTLPLHDGKVVNLVLPAPETAGEPRPGRNGNGIGAGPQPKPGSPEEVARYNRAVEEINRRRALREKGTGAGPVPSSIPGAPSASPVPQPPPR
jgi:hypothetical protein